MPTLTRLLSTLTSPLLPEDYLGLVNPLWSTSELRGRIVSVRLETADTATITIQPGRGWRTHVPGQWVRIGIDIDGVRHWRTFSISSAPGTLQITVQAVGLVTNHLVHGNVQGSYVVIDQPEGEFVLPENCGKVLFLTAGSGITPVMSMLRAGCRDAVVLHSARTPADVVFGWELRSMPGVTIRHTATEGRLDPVDLPELVPDLAEREIFACGPAGFLDAVEKHHPGVRTERFQLMQAAVGEGGSVTFTKSGVEATTAGPILTAGEEAGALLPSGCRMGICYSCVGKLTSGKVRDLRTGEVHGDEGQLIQTCVSAPAGPCSIDL